ncbi:MAG TPA: GDP-mannose 4,6-dehydratase [Candidatus Dormibacteraeota bacterium]|jgi:UDP-glucose 4-epimerase|nr:GDP-mannose 4,6-dehydratase [Candidatus Dormibacteraeota bacterium]
MRIQGKRVLVTGGAGFIGSHLVELLAIDNDVTVVDDLSAGSLDNIAHIPSVLFIEGDIRERSSIEPAVADAEVIFHMAVVCLRVSIPDPMAAHLVNDLGTLNLLMAARAHGVERFVYCSSSEVYGTAERPAMDEGHPLNPTTPYGAGKLAGEAYSLSFEKTYGLPVTVVRPFNSYGPREHAEGASGEVIPRFVGWALAGQPLPVFGDGRQTRDFTWVGDTARGIKMAAEHDPLVGRVINIARGEEVEILRIAELIRELVAPVPIEHRDPRPGDVRRHCADVTLARKELGYEAPIGIEEGLRRYVEWVKAQPAQSWTAREGAANWQAEPSPV